jgi:twitching motility protein PilJ
MSFLNKIIGKNQDEAALSAATSTAPSVVDASGAPSHIAFGVDTQSHQSTMVSSGYDAPTMQHSLNHDSSIITEAAPSEIADFAETRYGSRRAGAALITGLPLIGNRPVAQQQRILFAMVTLGLLGLILMTVWSLVVANRGAAQLNASGQALMQSQRLAKQI